MSVQVSLRAGRAKAGRFVATVLLSLALAPASSCTQAVDFKKTLEVTDVSGGWFDAGILDGKNKLVPSVSFRIRKPANVRLRSLSINVHFKKVVDPSKPGLEGEEEFDEAFLQTVEFSEGAQTALLPVRAQAGFTGDPPQTRAEMLQNSHFRDMRVRMFAKESSTTWVELLTFDIPRIVLTK